MKSVYEEPNVSSVAQVNCYIGTTLGEPKNIGRGGTGIGRTYRNPSLFRAA